MAVESIADPVQNPVDTPLLPGFLHDQFPCQVYYRNPPTGLVQPSGKLLGASDRANRLIPRKIVQLEMKYGYLLVRAGYKPG